MGFLEWVLVGEGLDGDSSWGYGGGVVACGDGFEVGGVVVAREGGGDGLVVVEVVARGREWWCNRWCSGRWLWW